MDKKQGRQILYRPAEQIEPGKSHNDVKQINTTPKKEDSASQKEGIKMAKWFELAKAINKSVICKDSGLDRANLDKFIKMGEIPEKHINKIKPIIKVYGYK